MYVRTCVCACARKIAYMHLHAYVRTYLQNDL